MRNTKVQERRQAKRDRKKFLKADVGDVIKRTWDYDGNWSEIYYLVLDVDECEDVMPMYKLWDIQNHNSDWAYMQNDERVTFEIVTSVRKNKDEVQQVFHSSRKEL